MLKKIFLIIILAFMAILTKPLISQELETASMAIPTNNVYTTTYTEPAEAVVLQTEARTYTVINRDDKENQKVYRKRNDEPIRDFRYYSVRRASQDVTYTVTYPENANVTQPNVYSSEPVTTYVSTIPDAYTTQSRVTYRYTTTSKSKGYVIRDFRYLNSNLNIMSYHKSEKEPIRDFRDLR